MNVVSITHRRSADICDLAGGVSQSSSIVNRVCTGALAVFFVMPIKSLPMLPDWQVETLCYQPVCPSVSLGPSVSGGSGK